MCKPAEKPRKKLKSPLQTWKPLIKMFKESKERRADGKTEQLKISIKKKPYLALKTMESRLVYPVDIICTNK